jgi:hypothetical protein
MLYTCVGISFRRTPWVGARPTEATCSSFPKGRRTNVSFIRPITVASRTTRTTRLVEWPFLTSLLRSVSKKETVCDLLRKAVLICFRVLSLLSKLTLSSTLGINARPVGTRGTHLPHPVPYLRTSSPCLQVFLTLRYSLPVFSAGLAEWLYLYYNPRFDSHSFLSFRRPPFPSFQK